VLTIVGIVLLLAGVGGAAYVLTDPGDDSEAEQAAQPAPAAAESPEPAATAAATEEPVATVAPTGTAFEAGRYARLGSFRTESRAQEVATDLQAKGLDAYPIASDDGKAMVPAFYVVVAGPLATAREERSVVRAAKRAGVKDAFVDDLEPAPDSADPAALGGEFSGTLRQNNPRVKRLNRDLGTVMSFAPDGQSATVTYDRPACEGTLTLADQRGSVLTYDESITSGRCPDGGSWHVRLEGERLQATWWRPDDYTFVLGRLER
jgi:hypothetical protein